MQVYESLTAAIADQLGNGLKVQNRMMVSGGDINDAYCLSMSDGNRLFLKTNAKKNLPFFEAEWIGIDAMRKTGAVTAPRLYAMGTDGDRAFLLMEWIESTRPSAGYMENLGHSLAQMHCSKTDPENGFGFQADNFIGANVQLNSPRETWIEFFRDMRLQPQMRMADHWLDTKQKSQCEFLLSHLDEFLTEPERPSLLHGDLWGGNVMPGPEGEPVLIDPAVYAGHHEADLAMTELFGGFGETFYRAYNEVYPVDPGYKDRRDLYNLYHMLNHLNLFGRGYLGSVDRILQRYEGDR